jgi:hypothetical protein
MCSNIVACEDIDTSFSDIGGMENSRKLSI